MYHGTIIQIDDCLISEEVFTEYFACDYEKCKGCCCVILYTCAGNGTPFSIPTTKTDGTCGDGTTICSSVFRIEKIDGNCATFRVLAPNTDTTTGYPYEATNSFFTMNLNCLCAIRCLNDTFVECI